VAGVPMVTRGVTLNVPTPQATTQPTKYALMVVGKRH
jgi:hypothetical protein